MATQQIPMSSYLRETTLQNLSQTKEFYEKASASSEAALETLNSSLHPEVAKLNRKMMTFFDESVSNLFDVSEKLAHAKTVNDVFQIQSNFFASQHQKFQRFITEITKATSVAQTIHPYSGVKDR